MFTYYSFDPNLHKLLEDKVRFDFFKKNFFKCNVFLNLFMKIYFKELVLLILFIFLLKFKSELYLLTKLR
jgi:hypothetical protein